MPGHRSWASRALGTITPPAHIGADELLRHKVVNARMETFNAPFNATQSSGKYPRWRRAPNLRRQHNPFWQPQPKISRPNRFAAVCMPTLPSASTHVAKLSLQSPSPMSSVISTSTSTISIFDTFYATQSIYSDQGRCAITPIEAHHLIRMTTFRACLQSCAPPASTPGQ